MLLFFYKQHAHNYYFDYGFLQTCSRQASSHFLYYDLVVSILLDSKYTLTYHFYHLKYVVRHWKNVVNVLLLPPKVIS